MSYCKEIGGYFALETEQNPPFHPNATTYNSGRSALRALIRAGNIKQLAVPYYTCPVIWEVLRQENCRIFPYGLTEEFLPPENLPKDIPLLYTDYFGICSHQVTTLEKHFPHLIVDNAQAFYAPLRGWGSFYSPRKFFGLPDGGLALSRHPLMSAEEEDYSFDRCSHLLKRMDVNAQAGYLDFQKNDSILTEAGFKKMSRLTRILMGNLNYERSKEKRLENFYFLHKALGQQNLLKIELDKGIPMVYPFLTRRKNLRQQLIAKKIFIATYWPDLESLGNIPSFERFLQTNLLALPLDQRYTPNDLQYVLEIILHEI